MRRIQRQTSILNSVKCKRNGDHGDESKSYSLCYSTDWKLDEFLENASNEMEMYPLAQRVFNAFGTEITDVLMFGENNAIVYLTDKKNEDFIPIPLLDDGQSDMRGGLPAMMGDFKVGMLLDTTKHSKYPRVAALMTKESTGEQLVCKFIPKTALDVIEVVNCLAEELRCLASLSHPNIMKFQRRDNLATHVVLVFDPWFGSNMRTHIINHGVLTEDQAQTVITQVASALNYMHLKGVIHSAICLDNIVMKMPNVFDHVILTGFHQATSRKAGGGFQRQSLSGANIQYTAPEAFASSPFIGAPTDVWALGVVYFALLHGRFPYSRHAVADKSPLPVSALQAITFDIKTGSYVADPTLSPESRFAIKTIFTLDAHTRPDISEALRLFEKSVPVPWAFLSSTEQERSIHGEGDGVEVLEFTSQHGHDAATKFPSITTPTSSGAPPRRNSGATGGLVTLSVADPSDTIKLLAAPLIDTYARLTQMALSTLDRAKNAATQGRRASTRSTGSDMATLQGKGQSQGKAQSLRSISTDLPTTLEGGTISPTGLGNHASASASAHIQEKQERRASSRHVTGDVSPHTTTTATTTTTTTTTTTPNDKRASRLVGPNRATFGSVRDLHNNHEDKDKDKGRSARSVSPAPDSRRIALVPDVATLEAQTASATATASASAMFALDCDDNDDINRSKRPLFKARQISTFHTGAGTTSTKSCDSDPASGAGSEIPPVIQQQVSHKVLLIDVIA